jgi:peptidylprolyl isomerase
MPDAKSGNTKKVNYPGTLRDGTQFDSSRGREPLAFTLGNDRVISGFETAVEGMSVGRTKTVTVPAEDAYGPHRYDLTHEVPSNAIPDDIELSGDMVLHAQGPEGQDLRFPVLAFDDQKAKIDGSHPLAGKDLTFELELMAVV